MERDYWMSAEETQAYGLVDQVIAQRPTVDAPAAS
jgi:ATP-dependent protease ClpP protease subunit